MAFVSIRSLLGQGLTGACEWGFARNACPHFAVRACFPLPRMARQRIIPAVFTSGKTGTFFLSEFQAENA